MPPEPWLVFKVEDTHEEGVEPVKLARLLDELSSAMYAFARHRLSISASRPGPKSNREDAVAGVRVLRVEPGSTVIEFLPPKQGIQGQLFDADVTPDDVAEDLANEIEGITSGRPAVEGRWELRRRVRAVLEQAAEIGERGRVTHHPVSKHGNAVSRSTTFDTRELPAEHTPSRMKRRAQLVGHAYMVDVEPGRHRMRLKLPDGRDLTLDVDEELASVIPAALNMPVQVQVEEEMEGATAVSRIVDSITVLESPELVDTPPKSVEQLERELALPSVPDYVAISSEIWPTQDNLDEFLDYLRESRRSSLTSHG
jgi:hypothetical protein